MRDRRKLFIEHHHFFYFRDKCSEAVRGRTLVEKFRDRNFAPYESERLRIFAHPRQEPGPQRNAKYICMTSTDTTRANDLYEDGKTKFWWRIFEVPIVRRSSSFFAWLLSDDFILKYSLVAKIFQHVIIVTTFCSSHVMLFSAFIVG